MKPLSCASGTLSETRKFLEDGLSFLCAIWRRKWYPILTTALLLTAACLYLAHAKPAYQASQAPAHPPARERPTERRQYRRTHPGR